jgi:hypothetical protein
MENAASTEKETVVERVTNTLATPLAGFATFLYATWQLVWSSSFSCELFSWSEWVSPG